MRALLVAAATLVAPLPSRAQDTGTAWAVVIGINDYISFDDETGDLRGAEHDALSFQDVLVTKLGLPPEQVLLLLSREATKAGIREALTSWLPARVRSEDRVFFFYAGHGAQAYDESGDEPDGLDETLGPADALPGSAANDILDDELQEWLRALAASEIIVILDSCNSGTATRIGGVYARPRRLERGLSRTAGAEAGEFTLVDEAGDFSRIVEVAAAAPGQSAIDAAFMAEDGSVDFFGGAFTTHLVWTLWLAPRDATFRDVFRRARSTLKAERFAQDPQFTAAADLPVFRATSAPTESAAPEVLALEPGGEARVSLGPPGLLGEHVVLRTQAGGLLRVSRVGVSDALALVMREPVRVSDRLSAAGVILPDRTLRVATQDMSAAQERDLAGMVDDGGDVEWLGASGANRADLVVARAQDGRLVVFGRDGLAREAPPSSPGQDELAWVARRIEWELAVQRLASLATASTRYNVRVSMNDQGGTYEDGEPIEITVESDVAGYVTLLEISAAGTLQVILPNPYSGALEIRPGSPLRIPGPMAPFEFDAAPPYGLGFVEAIVTPEPLELAVDQATLSTSDAAGVAGSITAQLGRQVRGDGVEIDVRASEEILGDRAWAAGLVSYKVVGPR